ncbi:MAG TPA: hypothetical protein VJ501_00190 [Burkholderiaceae bacterium]|nr:hypothetical protein [Burkholderiaceae bacterium]
MSPAFTIRIFGSYVLLTGATLLIAPQLLLGLFGFAATDDVWVRVLGAVAVVLGYYYRVCGSSDARAFFAASIVGRLAFCAMMAGLVLTGAGPWMLLLFGAVDVAGALWTWVALRGAAADRPLEL